MEQSSQRENLFTPDVLDANRSGCLTQLQQYRLGLRMFLWNSIQMIIGIGACYMGWSVLQSDQNLMLLLLFLAFGVTFVVRGLQGWRNYMQDQRAGVQQIKGAVLVAKNYEAKTSDRGIARFSTRYYLHVHPHAVNANPLTFQIDRNLYRSMMSDRQRDIYTVYYLPATKELLSFE